MSTTTPNLGLFKYNTTTDTAVPFSIDNALNANWDIIDQRCGASRNIGEIVSSTVPLVDAELHLLDGSLINGDGIYSEFVSYMANLYGNGSNVPNYFCSQSDWEDCVTEYGVCGKFVYDSLNNTIRLPKITGIIEGTTDVTALGELVEAGLPNITGMHNGTGSANWSTADASGAFANSITDGTAGYAGGGYQLYKYRINFDASSSSSIYGNSDSVQPQTIKVFYYIVIANAVKTGISVDIDEIATDLNNKADLSDMVEVQCIIETYSNGTSWYRVYSDGWCEQGGKTGKRSGNGYFDITFLKEFSNTDYSVQQSLTGYSSNANESLAIVNLTTTGCRLYMWDQRASYWQASGYII